jgi:hypothetical protein
VSRFALGLAVSRAKNSRDAIEMEQSPGSPLVVDELLLPSVPEVIVGSKLIDS